MSNKTAEVTPLCLIPRTIFHLSEKQILQHTRYISFLKYTLKDRTPLAINIIIILEIADG